MIYKNHHGSFITVHTENIRTHKYGEHVLAEVLVVTSSPAGTYRSTCSVAGRSSRLARVAMKKELQRAKAMADTPGFTH